MKIGQVASLTGVSRDTVRLYEKMGILGKVERPNPYNNYKEYGEENIYRIKMVKQMQSLGLKLKECKVIIEALVSGDFSPEERKTFILSKIEEVKQKIKALKGIQSILQEHIDNDCAFNSEDMIERLKSKL